MKKLRKSNKIISLLLSAVMLLSVCPSVFAATGIPAEKKDDLHTKILVNSSFGSILDRYKGELSYTGYDMNTAGGKLDSGTGLNMTDSSTFLPVGSERKFEDVTYGNLIWKFPIHVSAKMEGMTVSLRNNTTPVTQLYYGKEYIYCIGANGEMHQLIEYKTATYYYVEVHVDMDAKLVKAVYIDGKERCGDVKLINELPINNFCIRTGDESTGSFRISNMFIARGYDIHEEFQFTGGNVPDSWDVKADLEKSTFSSKAYFKEQDGDVVLSRKIEPVTCREIAEFQILVPTPRKGVKVSLLGEGKEVISFGTDGDQLTCNGQPFYKYMPTVWYDFKVDTDLANGTADVKLNGIDRLSDVKTTGVKVIDEIRLEITGEGTGDVGFDNIYVYPYEEIENYVPEPQKVESEGIDLGMQYCNMWSEGHHFGWDYTTRSPGRRSLAGYYDEAYYESVDWEIKWMVEHGIDFIWDCWYMGGATDAPYQDTNMFNPFHTSNGFFDAKYRDQIKFCIMWENTVNNGAWNKSAKENAENFLKYLGPYWIEYYLKDPSYYKPGGRPIISIYWAWYNPFGGERAWMFEEFKKMCVEAGVGEPIFMQQMNLEAQTLDYYRDFPKQGFEGTYNYANAKLPDDCVQSNLTRMNMIKEYNLPVMFIPTISQGFDVYTWGLDGGYLLNDPELFRRSITLVKEQVLPELEPIGENKVLMLGTWNEYHEGHYIAPTEDHGFTLLDVIREEFAGGGEHEDVVPTEEQKDRISNWYPENRVLPIFEKPIPLEIPADAKVLGEWDFEEGMDGFDVVGANSFEVLDGALVIEGKNNKVVVSNESLNIDFHNATHIKLTVDNSEDAAYDAEVSYKTSVIDEYHNHHGHDIYMSTGNTGEFDVTEVIGERVDYVKGDLTALRLSFNNVLEGKKFKIKSITLYGDDSKEQADDEIVFNSAGYKQNVKAKMENDKPLIPLRTVVEELKGKTFWDDATNSINVKMGNDVYTVHPGKETYLKNNEENSMAVYAQVVDGVTYVSMDFISVLTDKDIKWNSLTRELTIEDFSSFKLVRPNNERKIIKSWEFNTDGNRESWGVDGWLYSVDSSNVSGGTYNMTYSKGAPIIFSANGSTGVNTADVKLISFGIKSDVAYNGKIYFTTSDDLTFKEQMAFGLKIQASKGIVEYTMDTSKIGRWTGILHRIRMDMGNNISNTVQLDYVRLYGDFERELSQEELANRYSSITSDSDKIGWDFNLNNEIDGWRFNRDTANIKAEGGMLNMRTLTRSSAMQTVAMPEVLADSIKKIELRMLNKTLGTKLKLYFITDADNTWNEEKLFELSTTAMDTVGQIYTIDVSNNSLWTGKIKGLKIVPANAEGTVQMDYVYLKY